jgi:FAD/FMN-containing dehydrogenase
MKIKRASLVLVWVIYCLFLSVYSALAGTTMHQEYKKNVDQFNRELAHRDKSLSCPGVQLAVSCGNRKCELSRGEDEGTCPADCITASVRSYDLQVSCVDVKRLFFPENVQEVQEIVKNSASSGLKIRVVGRGHSVNNQYCTDGIVISTAKLNHVIRLEPNQNEEVVVVEPGVTMIELMEWLHEHGKSLGYAVMGFRGMTVGGAIATGSHGSSPKHTAVISSLVRSISTVLPSGELVEISGTTENQDLLKALRASLGMLGVIVEIKLAVVPQFNLHVRVTHDSDKRILHRNGLWKQIEKCDFGQMNWFPSVGRFIKTCGTATEKPVDQGANNVLLNPSFPKGLLQPYKLALHYASCNKKLASYLEKIRYFMLNLQPPFQKENKKGQIIYTSDLIGFSHRMLSSDLISGRDGFFQTDWEFAVPLSQAQEAINTISKHFKSHHVHLPLVGVFLRFGHSEESSLLAHSASKGAFHLGEPIVFIEFPVFSPIGFPVKMLDAYNKPYEDLVKTLVTAYQARGHWGKNKNWVFQLQNKLGSYGDNLDRFQEIERTLDPYGVFINQFSKDGGISYQK